MFRNFRNLHVSPTVKQNSISTFHFSLKCSLFPLHYSPLVFTAYGHFISIEDLCIGFRANGPVVRPS